MTFSTGLERDPKPPAGNRAGSVKLIETRHDPVYVALAARAGTVFNSPEWLSRPAEALRDFRRRRSRLAGRVLLPTFIFEGSMPQDVERYFRGLGGELAPCYTAYKAWLPREFALKLIKREQF